MNVREITLSLLDDFELSGKYVNLSLSSHIADGLSREDRAFVTSLLYTAVERKITYDYYICAVSGRSIDSIDPHTMNILRLGVCQIVSMDSVPSHAAVNLTVDLARNRGERSFVNAVLRRISALNESGTLPLPDRNKNEARYISVVYSYPSPLTKRFIALFGAEDTERLFEYYNTVHYTDITVNTARISRAELMDSLTEQGLSVVPSRLSPLSLRISGSVNPTHIRGFNDGLFFVQDVASAVSVAALGVERGDRVVDVCACPGGKSFAAAIMAGTDGSVLSLDIRDSKLSLIESGMQRLGITNIEVGCNDAASSLSEYHGRFDRLICDVPCSGYGVLSKKPDLRYKDNQSVQKLPELQYRILTESVKYLRKGGVLVYSTCTLDPKENEENIHRFLSEHDGFTPVDFEIGGRSSNGGMLTLMPHIDICDGFFIAKIRKEND